jgi:hypothetical protein
VKRINAVSGAAVPCQASVRRRPGESVHYFLMSSLLLAVIHWRDHFAGHLQWTSPIVNTVPFVVLFLIDCSRGGATSSLTPGSFISRLQRED